MSIDLYSYFIETVSGTAEARKNWILDAFPSKY